MITGGGGGGGGRVKILFSRERLEVAASPAVVEGDMVSDNGGGGTG